MTDNDNGPVLGEDGAELFEELGSGSSPQNTPALPPEGTAGMTLWVPEMWNMAVGLAIGAVVWGVICLLTRR